MKRMGVWLCVALLGVGLPVWAAQGPTVQDVEQAIGKGKLDEAQQLMDKVLAEHPRSAKAHYVEAQLLAKKGDLAGGASELKAAEQLAPGLPFAKSDAVQALRQKLEAAPPVAPAEIQAPAPDTPPADEGGWPWGWILLAIGVLGLIVKLGKKSPPAAQSSLQRNDPGNAAPIDAAQAGAAPGAQQTAAAGGGMTGKIVGGLVAGAAIGAGLAAAEAIAHNLRDSDSSSSNDSTDSGLGLFSSSSWDSSDSSSSSSSDDGW